MVLGNVNEIVLPVIADVGVLSTSISYSTVPIGPVYEAKVFASAKSLVPFAGL